MKYHRGLMQAILNDRVQIAKAVNATVITLDEAPQGYEDFDSGVAKKFVLEPARADRCIDSVACLRRRISSAGRRSCCSG